MLAGLDRAGLVERHPDPAGRRRTIVQIIPAQAALIGHWLDGAAKPLARVLDELAPAEQEDRGGQGEDALQDADGDALGGVAAVALEVELSFLVAQT